LNENYKMLKTFPYSLLLKHRQVDLHRIIIQAHQEILNLHSTGYKSEIKVIAQLKSTIRVCQKEIAHQRRNSYQLRRITMQQRRPI
jgi:hypothetical protein